LVQDVPLRFCQSTSPVCCSKQHITDIRAEPQEHSSDHHNKNELLEINITEGETRYLAAVTFDV